MQSEGQSSIRSVERSRLRGMRTVRGGSERSARMGDASNNRPPRRPLPRRPMRRERSAFKKYFFTLTVVLVIAVVLLNTAFASARITVTLASADVTLDGVFSAIREPLSTADISYTQSRVYSRTVEEEIFDITREQETTRAAGTVTVYNTNPSGTRLDLVNRTRFQTADGRIYRMIGKQTIPGGKDLAGEFLPGSKEVKVEADDIGKNYNLSDAGVRFSIPGLAKFKPFADSYAVSNTPIVGGFNGERLIPDEKKEQEVRKALQERLAQELRAALQQSLETNTLAERVVFDEGVFIKYTSLEDVQNADSVTIREKGELKAILFREKDLAALLSQYAPESAPTGQIPESISASDITLEIEGDDSFDIFAPSEGSGELSFHMHGNAEIFWGIDDFLFIGDIIGKKKAAAKTRIFEAYPQVVNLGEIRIFPFWKTTLPKNRNKIELEIQYAN